MFLHSAPAKALSENPIASRRPGQGTPASFSLLAVVYHNTASSRRLAFVPSSPSHWAFRQSLYSMHRERRASYDAANSSKNLRRIVPFRGAYCIGLCLKANRLTRAGKGTNARRRDEAVFDTPRQGARTTQACPVRAVVRLLGVSDRALAGAEWRNMALAPAVLSSRLRRATLICARCLLTLLPAMASSAVFPRLWRAPTSTR